MPPEDSVNAEDARTPSAGLARWVRWLLWLVGAGLLTTLVVPNILQKFVSTGYRGKEQQDLLAIEYALEEYAARNGGQFPDDLSALVTPDEHGNRYLQTTTMPRDPWGHPYVYRHPPASNSKPIVFSVGKDGLPETEDDMRLEPVER
jgi:general secretion pathway protein G